MTHPVREGPREGVKEGWHPRADEAVPLHCLLHPDWRLTMTRNGRGTQVALVFSPSQSSLCWPAVSRRHQAREASVRDEPDANITKMDFPYGVMPCLPLSVALG